MAVNYEDPRFSQVEADKNEALTDLEQTYAGIIGNSDQYYQAQIDASKQWADTQSKLQQDNTDFTIEQIEQQKAQAQKDYTKEQSGAYVDWQKQSNEYGTEAEKIASAGMAGTGFSESSQVSMYNTYQNRVVTARESYNQAVMNYNNAIKDARLQNNAVLAEIAYQSLQQQLELSLQGFQYKNQLILEQANKKTELENTYYGRYMDVLNQINQENALAEEQRQFNQNYALSMQQMQEEIRQYNQSYSLQVKEYEEGIRQFNEEIARLKAKDKQEHQREIQQLELQKKQYELEKQQIAEQKRQFDKEMAEKQRQFDAELAYQKSKSSGSSGGSISKSSGSGGSGGVIAPEAKTYAVNTPYYQGDLNPDAKKYGTYSNGYQPKGISGYGKLSRTDDVIEFNTQTLSGQNQTVTQTVWKTPDGSRWYWEGRKNKYIRINTESQSQRRRTNAGGGVGGGGGKF